MGYEELKILWIFLGGHHKIGLYLGVISIHLGFFLRARYRMRDILAVAIISNIFWVLEIPDIFWGRTVDAGPEPTYTEKIRVGLPPCGWRE